MYTNDLIVCEDALIQTVLSAAMSVHSLLGPGLLESAYEEALMMELSDRLIGARSQVEVPAFYKRRMMNVSFFADIIVENSLIIELEACTSIEPIHKAQLLNHQKLLRFKRGLLINFNCESFKDGVKFVSI